MTSNELMVFIIMIITSTYMVYTKYKYDYISNVFIIVQNIWYATWLIISNAK